MKRIVLAALFAVAAAVSAQTPNGIRIQQRQADGTGFKNIEIDDPGQISSWIWDESTNKPRFRIDQVDGSAPTANEDSGDGYEVGSVWVDTAGGTAYVCVDATLTAAVWVDIGAGAGSLSVEDVAFAAGWNADLDAASKNAIYDYLVQLDADSNGTVDADELGGLGTGVATALGVNVGSAGAFITFDGAGGTPSALTLTNATGLPISTGVSGLGANVAAFLGTASSANLRAALSDESGAGVALFNNFADNTGLLDANGDEVVVLQTAGSANYLSLRNAGAFGDPVIETLGSDTNVNLSFLTQGSGQFLFQGTANITGDGTLTGDLAVNGDDITSDGDLTINAVGDDYNIGSAAGSDAQRLHIFDGNTDDAPGGLVLYEDDGTPWILFVRSDGTLAINQAATITDDDTDGAAVDSAGSGLGSVLEDTSPQLGGELDANGNSIADATDGDVRVNDDLSVAGDVLPDADSTRDIGADANRFANIYADNLDLLSATIDQLAYSADTVLTLSTGAVTRTQTWHTIAAETGTTDDLDTINGGTEGYEIIIQADTGDTITLKDGTGNLDIGADIALTDGLAFRLLYDGTNWIRQYDNAGAGGGAPTDATYWVASANGTLSAEVVVNDADSLGTAIGGEVSGTGNFARVTSPTFVTPALGTIASGVGTALTALNGENLQNDTVDDDSLDFGTGADQIDASDIPIADTGAIFTAADLEAAILELAKVPVNTKSGAYTIGTDDPRECYGGVITVTAAATITGPATLVEGMSWTIKGNVAGAVVFNPDDADTITLDGTALAAGDSVTSTSTLGDIATFVAMSASAIDATTNDWTDTN